jgi:hypothetical protein
MSPRYFFKVLAAVTAGTAALLALLHLLVSAAREHWGLSIITLLVFVLLNVGLFYAGKSTARSTNRMAFSGLVSASVFGKMVLALAMLFVYREVAQPTNQWFVGVFLLAYVVYTVFEVWFMTIVAKEK